MDVQINEVHSTVRTVDSKTLVDPQVMRQIVQACVKAVKEQQSRDKQLASDRKISSSASSES
jgi:hypothetical protein